jgi:hypothetical protein
MTSKYLFFIDKKCAKKIVAKRDFMNLSAFLKLA